MCVQAVIEITSSSDGGLPARLLAEAYRASDCGVIILVLNGVTPIAVDRVLDHLVAALPLSIPGVLYVDVGNDAAVDRALRAAEVVFVATRALRRRAQECKVECRAVMPVEVAVAWLSWRHHRSRARVQPVMVDEPSVELEHAGPPASVASEASVVALPA